MKGFISKEQRDKIVEEIKKGNPFDGHVATLAKVKPSTVKRYRRLVAEGRSLLYYEGI